MIDIVLFVLVFCIAWYIGANEESFAGLVASRVLKTKTAVLIGAVAIFIGSFFFSDPVSQTFRERLLTQTVVRKFTFSVLLSMVIWFGVCLLKKWPISTTASIIGAMAGASFVFNNPFNYSVLIEVILGVIISPIAGILISYFLYSLMRGYFKRIKNFEEKEILERRNSILLMVVTFLVAISRGANDIPNAIAFFSDNIYFKIFGSIAFALGLIVGGKRIIKNIGTKLVQLSPTSALCAQIATFLVVATANYLKLPISGSIVFISALVGSGLAIRKRIGKGVYKELVFAWLITLPVTVALSTVLSLI